MTRVGSTSARATSPVVTRVGPTLVNRAEEEGVVGVEAFLQGVDVVEVDVVATMARREFVAFATTATATGSSTRTMATKSTTATRKRNRPRITTTLDYRPRGALTRNHHISCHALTLVTPPLLLRTLHVLIVDASTQPYPNP
jgi:hypothetical protein